ncbi:MAG: tRNA uracil 4-sulfurtransferase ThiI [Spirochaetia bacterium]
MNESFYLLKIGELMLKGKNRSFFEKTLKNNIKKMFREYSPRIDTRSGRFYLTLSGIEKKEAESRLESVFGINAFAEAVRCPKEMKALERTALRLLDKTPDGGTRTFKVRAKRTDKSFPADSYEISCRLGDVIRENFPGYTVDVKNPDITLNVEVRNNAYLYIDSSRGAGGLPAGVAGKSILLLSGGIDSPVAGWMMAKRGLTIDAVHFHSYPYTSNEALEKTKTLARILAKYQAVRNFFVIPFTQIQLAVKKKAPASEGTLLNRACMMRIAHLKGLETGAGSLITGESLSQVASQTQASLRFSGSMTDLPVFRPLIGLDKEEIIRTARKIGTYETSILPFEDCCTVFSPAHPLINPDFEKISESFHALEIDTMMEEAAGKAEKIQMIG